MVSPELLRRFPFFGIFTDDQLKKVAMISEEIDLPAGAKIFDECNEANEFYLLISGSVDLTYKSEEEYHPKSKKVFPVGEINPEEVFGISSVLEPYEYNATALVSKDSQVIKMDGAMLRKMMKEDPEFGCSMMHQIAKAIMERLTYTRIQLAAAWA